MLWFETAVTTVSFEQALRSEREPKTFWLRWHSNTRRIEAVVAFILGGINYWGRIGPEANRVLSDHFLANRFYFCNHSNSEKLEGHSRPRRESAGRGHAISSCHIVTCVTMAWIRDMQPMLSLISRRIDVKFKLNLHGTNIKQGFLAHMRTKCKVSFCDGPLSVVHRASVRQHFFLTNFSSETAHWILTKLHRNEP